MGISHFLLFFWVLLTPSCRRLCCSWGRCRWLARSPSLLLHNSPVCCRQQLWKNREKGKQGMLSSWKIPGITPRWELSPSLSSTLLQVLTPGDIPGFHSSLLVTFQDHFPAEKNPSGFPHPSVSRRPPTFHRGKIWVLRLAFMLDLTILTSTSPKRSHRAKSTNSHPKFPSHRGQLDLSSHHKQGIPSN